MLRRALLSLLLLAIVAACGPTTPPKPSPKPSPVPMLTQSQITAVVKNFWEVRGQAFTHDEASLLATVYAGPALDQARVELARANRPLPTYSSHFVAATAVNLSQPPQADWFMTTITYNAVDQDGVVSGQVTEGTWVFVFVPSATPDTSSSPAPSPSATNTVAGNWMAYLRYGILVHLGTSLTQANSHLKRPKETDYLFAASLLADDYSTYLTQLAAGQQTEAPYTTDLFGLPSQSLAHSNSFVKISETSFTPYANQPLITYIDDNKDEVVLFALRRTVTYRPQSPATCFAPIFSSDLSLLATGQYRSAIISKELLVVASILPNGTPAKGGRLLVGLEGESNDSSETHVTC